MGLLLLLLHMLDKTMSATRKYVDFLNPFNFKTRAGAVNSARCDCSMVVTSVK
jgi:hypothetical protein